MLRTDDPPMLRADDRSSLAADPAFRRDVVNGLGARPRTIPPRWLYDRDGSALFEEITTLPEYYVTRTERTLLQSAAAEIAELVGPGRAVVEFGCGSCSKTRILLTALSPTAYVPIDISGGILRTRRQSFRQYFPGSAYCRSMATSRTVFGFRRKLSDYLSLVSFPVLPLVTC